MSDQPLFDKRSFEPLFRTYFPSLCAFARKYVEDTDDCKDIVHQVFINLWERRNSLDTSFSLKPYLFKSVHNRCLNYIRDRKKIVSHHLPMENEEIPDYIESQDYMEQSELEAKIRKSIDELPDRCKEVFRMSRFEDKKYAEIAEELGISVKAVEAQMSKALKTLREKLAEYMVTLFIFLMSILG